MEKPSKIEMEAFGFFLRLPHTLRSTRSMNAIRSVKYLKMPSIVGDILSVVTRVPLSSQSRMVVSDSAMVNDTVMVNTDWTSAAYPSAD